MPCHGKKKEAKRTTPLRLTGKDWAFLQTLQKAEMDDKWFPMKPKPRRKRPVGY
jgi:hypothetical protein